MRSGHAHCDLELTVEIRRCPLQRKAGEDYGEEKKDEKNEEEKEKKEEEEDQEEEEERTALIKSNNPHLTGGEKVSIQSGIYRI